MRPLAKDEDKPEFSHQQSQEEMEVEEQGMVPSESEYEEEEGGTGASASRGGRKKKVNYGKESQDNFCSFQSRIVGMPSRSSINMDPVKMSPSSGPSSKMMSKSWRIQSIIHPSTNRH